jgi:hypothetical protein
MAMPLPQKANIADSSSPAASTLASSQPITAVTYQVRSLDSIWKIVAGMERGLGNISDRMQLLRVSNRI